MTSNNRENFGSHFAVIMAMAGSAIGLGNIWRFPYIAGEMGGGAFVLIYCLCTLLFSIPMFMTEVIIGRRSGSNAANAMYELSGHRKFWAPIGLILVMCPLFITSYYSVVGGWAIDFFFRSLNFSFSGDSEQVSSIFESLITTTYRPVIMHLVFLGITVFVVSRGVKSGIERFSKYTVPVLFMMILVIMTYSFSLPGAEDGIKYLLKFDASALTPRTLAYALGQSFYSLSLGMGTIITFGSYVKKDENILRSSAHVATSDLFFALLSAFAIMPAVFAAGMQPDAGPGLIFKTIPYIFAEMGVELPVVSGIIAIVFFFTILVAALTSAVSMVEVGVSYIVENSKLSRRAASMVIFVLLGVVGALCSLGFGPLSSFQVGGMGIFDVMDWFSSNILLIVAAILATVFAGWVMKKEDFCDEMSSGGRYSLNAKIAPAIYFVVRYIAPFIIFAILVSNFI